MTLVIALVVIAIGLAVSFGIGLILYKVFPCKASKTILKGDLFQDCRGHPCLCIKVDGDDIEGVSLVDGVEGSCSIEHCHPPKLTPREAMDMTERLKNNG